MVEVSAYQQDLAKAAKLLPSSLTGNILITGATGLIGGCLTDMLMQHSECHVYALGRNRQRAEQRFLQYKDNPRFTFMRFEDRGHNDIFIAQDNTYLDDLNGEFAGWIETLDYDYKAEENKEKFAQDKINYINENLDREKYSHRLDEELFDQFLEFYEQALK